jgi:hypothetical protein
MDTTVYEARMTAVAEAFNTEQFAEALAASRELKQDLVAQAQLPASTHGTDEQIQLGWAHFYEFKSLFAQEKFQSVFDLLARPEEVALTIGVKNAGWMYSVGAECAMRLGESDRIAEFGERCFELRQQLEDEPMSAFECVQTMLHLLNEAQRPDLYRPWAVRLMAIGTEHGADLPVIAGVDRLLDHVEATQDTESVEIVREARTTLAEMCEGEFSGEATETLARLDQVCPAP